MPQGGCFLAVLPGIRAYQPCVLACLLTPTQRFAAPLPLRPTTTTNARPTSLPAALAALPQMATLGRAEELLEQLRGASIEAGQRDLTEVQEFAAEQGAGEALAHWDVSFWSERLKEAKYALEEEQLRPYFALPNVLEVGGRVGGAGVGSSVAGRARRPRLGAAWLLAFSCCVLWFRSSLNPPLALTRHPPVKRARPAPPRPPSPRRACLRWPSACLTWTSSRQTARCRCGTPTSVSSA